MNYTFIICFILIALCSFYLEQSDANGCNWGRIFGKGKKGAAKGKGKATPNIDIAKQFNKFKATYKEWCELATTSYECREDVRSAIENLPTELKQKMLEIWAEKKNDAVIEKKGNKATAVDAFTEFVSRILARVSGSAMNLQFWDTFSIKLKGQQWKLLSEINLNTNDNLITIQQKFDTMVTAKFERMKTTAAGDSRNFLDAVASIRSNISIKSELILISYHLNISPVADVITRYRDGIKTFGHKCLKNPNLKNLFDAMEEHHFDFTAYANVNANKELNKKDEIEAEYARVFIQYARALHTRLETMNPLTATENNFENIYDFIYGASSSRV